MSGDYTRFTFDPLKRYAGVWMQQGRVQLDADWNEGVDILRDRTRKLSLDVLGPVGVPTLVTPNAFLIGLLAGPPADLTIGPGRIYIDGYLAENFDPPATYLTQPFLPDPPPLPAGDALVFLDLWEREISYIGDPQLLDVALGGVDTTTRIQQVWQLRAVAPPLGMGAACGVDLDALFPTSAGRLTTEAIAPPAPDDPCILPPLGGYRGLENRLYRVEVHNGGALGVARFKWSRDDGSIVSSVSALAVAGGQTRLNVNRIGRDQVLRFRIGDWVTVTDDHRELHEEPGEMAQIVAIDESGPAIVLDRALPTPGQRPFGALPADLIARRTRVQLWNQSAAVNVVDADGLIATAAGPIDIEDGIRVRFDMIPAGGEFHAGDYWVFAARTADASVEILNKAPPRGIIHHYGQLAAISGGVVTDCRPKPTAVEGCCTFVVKPGGDIQAAIDALPDVGGCVCLKSGLHLIDASLVIRRDNVTLHGESMGAVVFNRRGTTLLTIGATQGVRVHTIVFRQGEAATGPVIAVEGAEDLVIDDCGLQTAARPRSIGLMAVATRQMTVSSCALAMTTIGVWLEKGCNEITISGCNFDMPPLSVALPTSVAVLARSMRGFLTVTDNLVIGAANGVIINDATTTAPVSRAVLSQVTYNRIALAQTPPGASRAFGVDIAAARSIVVGNQISMEGGVVTAVRICGNGSTACGNVVASTAKTPGVIFGIQGGFEGAAPLPVERLIIADNIVEGPINGVALFSVARAEVIGNTIGAGPSQPVGFGVTLFNSTDCRVGSNTITTARLGIVAISGARNGFRDNRIDGGLLGIAVVSEEGPAIRGNRLTGVERFGVMIFGATQRCNVIENRVVRCGSRTPLAVAIGAVSVTGEWHVEANEIMDTGLPPGGGPGALIAYGIFGDLILEAKIQSNQVTYSDPTARSVAGEDRALRLRGALDFSVVLGGGAIRIGFAVQIIDNRFIGAGATALVELLEQNLGSGVFARFERVMFTGNYCAHFSVPFNDAVQAATVSLVGDACSVANNQVKATTPNFRSYHLHGMVGPFLGNLSHGLNWGRAPASEFPAPQSAFNMII